ncbi:hypothetical protein DENSPDRAFT_560707 [Dentipellis sp. KUC8613]|nr:hypothetical protein DENSPDRAFT_560707 [Dentipellis sp. KUC8613]
MTMSTTSIAKAHASTTRHPEQRADSTNSPTKYHRDGAASRARARERIDYRIDSTVSQIAPSEHPTVGPDARHMLATTFLSGDLPVNQILRLLTQRNELAPIRILPPELMSSIFIYIVHDAAARPAIANKRLALLSMVCLTWRHVTLSHPNLWTRIDMDQMRYAELAFTRSQNAPIDIYYCERSRIDKAPPYVLATVVDHAARIKSLNLSMYAGASSELMHIFPPSLPLLHTLQLDVMDRMRRRRTQSRRFQLRPSHLDPAIAHCTTPSLRVLKICGMLVPLALPMHHRLVQLAVEPLCQIRVDLLSLREMFAGCPELEFLRLRNIGLAPLDVASSPGAPVPLPKLRRVVLTDCAPGILSNLAIPSTAVFRVLSSGLGAASSRLSFFSSGGNGGKLYILNEGSDNQVLHSLPYVRKAVFESHYREDSNILSDLSAMFSELDMDHLEVLKAIHVPSTVLVEALSNRDVGALRRLVLISIPRIRTEEEMQDDMRLLRGLVAAVKVIGFKSRSVRG